MAEINLTNGMTSTGITIAEGEILNVSSGGVANSTTVNSAGWMKVHDGATANIIAVSSGGALYGWGTVKDATVYHSGTFMAYNGTVSGTVIDSGGMMEVHFSANVSDTGILNGGLLKQCEGVTDKTVVSSGGRMEFGLTTLNNAPVCRASATNVTVERGGTMLFLVTESSYAAGTIDGSAFEFDFKSNDLKNYTVSSRYELGVVNGLAENVDVRNGGQLHLFTFSGSTTAAASNTTVFSGGALQVYSSGASAKDTTISSGGKVYVSNGGSLSNTTILSGGVLSGANSAWNDSATTISKVTIASGGTMVHSFNGTMDDISVASGGKLVFTSSGASATNLKLEQGALFEFVVSKNTSLQGTYAGVAFEMKDGILENYSIASGGVVTVIGANATSENLSNRGSASKITVSSGGSMLVTRGGWADDITILAGGHVTVTSRSMYSVATSATDITVNYGATLVVSDRGEASIAFNPWSGSVISKSDAVVTYLGRDANVYYGGNTAGIISKADTMKDLEVTSGNTAIVYDGGKLTGNLNIAEGGRVFVEDGGTIDFDLTGQVSEGNALINDLTLVGGAPAYTITVTADQQMGLYRVADNIGAFSNTITVICDNSEIAELSADGSAEVVGDIKYCLLKQDNSLYLQVKSADETGPVITIEDYDHAYTEDPFVIRMTVADDKSGVKAQQYRINGGEWLDFDGSVTITQNCTLQFRAEDAVGNETLSEIISIDNIGTTAPATLPGGEFFTAIRKDGAITISLNGNGVDEFQVFMSTDGVAYHSIGVGSDGEFSFDWDKTAEVYFKVAFPTGDGNYADPSAPLRFKNNFVEGDTIDQLDKPVIGDLGKDENVTDGSVWHQDTAGKFVISGDFGNLNASVAVKNEKNKTVASGTIKKGILTFNGNKSVLLDKGDYTIILKNTDKGKTAADYSFEIGAEVLYDKIDNSDDWTDVKSKGADGAVAKTIGNLTAETQIENWVGFGDAVDYYEFTLTDDTKLNLNVSSTDAAKVVIYKLNEKTNTRTGVTTYSLKTLQTTTIAAGYTLLTKNLLLENGTYYIGVTSTNAKRGGNADYTITVDESGKFFSKVDNSDDWADVKTNGAAGAVGKIDGDFKIGTTVSDWVGYGDASDYKSFTITEDMTVSFDVKSSDAAKFNLYTLNENKNGTFSLKSLLSASVSAGQTVPTKTITLSAGTYYIGMTSTNAKKGGDADYTITVKDPNATVTPVIDNTDDWTDLKTEGVDGEVVKLGTLDENIKKTGWVGTGDAVDYMTFTLDNAASLSFDVSSTDAAKFVVYELKENYNKKTGVTTFSLKALQTTTIKTGYTIPTKNLLLESGKTYAIGVTSTNARKGGSAEYSFVLNDNTTFFTKADNSDDVFTDAEQINITSGVADGWVGYSDSVDYMEFTLDTAAKLNFDVASSDSAKFVIYQLNDKTGKLKALQTTTIKADTVMPTKDLFLAAGTYYISVTSTNAKKGGNADYSFSLNDSAVFYPEAGDATDNTWKLVKEDDAAALDGANINGWVGYSDAADFVKLELDGSGAISLELDEVTATAYERKELKITCVNEKGKAIALTYDAATESFTSKLTFTEGTVCYVGVSTTNQKKYDTEYQITAGILA